MSLSSSHPPSLVFMALVVLRKKLAWQRSANSQDSRGTVEECQWHRERTCNCVTIFRVLHTQQGHVVLIQQFPFIAIHSSVKGQTSPMIVSNSFHTATSITPRFLRKCRYKQELCCNTSVLVTQLGFLASVSCRWFCQACKFWSHWWEVCQRRQDKGTVLDPLLFSCSHNFFFSRRLIVSLHSSHPPPSHYSLLYWLFVLNSSLSRFFSQSPALLSFRVSQPFISK